MDVFISAVNPQNPLWCHDEEVGYSGLLGDSIGGEVVGFSCFVGRFLQEMLKHRPSHTNYT